MGVCRYPGVNQWVWTCVRLWTRVQVCGPVAGCVDPRVCRPVCGHVCVRVRAGARGGGARPRRGEAPVRGTPPHAAGGASTGHRLRPSARPISRRTPCAGRSGRGRRQRSTVAASRLGGRPPAHTPSRTPPSKPLSGPVPTPPVPEWWSFRLSYCGVEVCRRKAGSMKRGTPVVTGPTTPRVPSRPRNLPDPSLPQPGPCPSDRRGPPRRPTPGWSQSRGGGTRGVSTCAAATEWA